MAGLDPAAEATHKLVARLLQRKGADGRIKYDEFLKVRCKAWALAVGESLLTCSGTNGALRHITSALFLL